ncbi:hypothetical protein NEOC84_001718|nr:hypothetical protein [Neochlamydia sp. AcF84]
MQTFLLVLSCCFIFLFPCSMWADEEILSIYLTWQHHPQSTMNVCWITPQAQTQDFIEYQREGEEVWHREKSQHRPMPAQLPHLIHRVELVDLMPSTSYHFRLGADKHIYKFRTMPAESNLPIRFVVGGDMYNGSMEMMEKTNRAAAATNPLFVVIGGDIAYSAVGDRSIPENPQKWIDWLRIWKQTMVTSEGYLIPIVPCIGNHEVRGGNGKTPQEAEFFFALFPTLNLKSYKVLDFSSYMSLIILDSGHAYPVRGAQTLWLKQVLRQRRQVPHKFAVYHIPAYPSYRSYYNKTSRAVRRQWVPLFEQYGLHVAFENNDHAYKRTHPICKGRPQKQGVLYIGDGAWSVANIRTPKTPRQAWYIAKSSATQFFILVTIDGSHRRIQAFTPAGMIVDDVVQEGVNK